MTKEEYIKYVKKLNKATENFDKETTKIFLKKYKPIFQYFYDENKEFLEELFAKTQNYNEKNIQKLKDSLHFDLKVDFLGRYNLIMFEEYEPYIKDIKFWFKDEELNSYEIETIIRIPEKDYFYEGIYVYLDIKFNYNINVWLIMKFK